MRSLIALFALLVAPALAGCNGACGGGGTPYAKVVWPLQFGQEPEMVDGPRRLIVNERRAYDLGVIDNGAAARCQPANERGGYRVVAPAGQ